MGKRKVYHVVPGKKDGWDIFKEGNERASAHTGNKNEAIKRGRDLAKSGGPGQLKIHKTNGQIQTEYTYGDDPHPPDG